MNKEPSTIDPEFLRRTMRAWLTGVTVVTSRYLETQHGMTVNSFTSISLEPPVVAVSLAEDTRTNAIVRLSGIFAVTILDETQGELADRFAGRGLMSAVQDADRFMGVGTFALKTGAPLLKGGLAFLDCKVIHHLELGPTTVYYGEVIATGEVRTGQPLAYFNRLYRKLQL